MKGAGSGRGTLAPNDAGVGAITARRRCDRARSFGDYAADAWRIMAEHPSSRGWRKVESRPCRGRHPRTVGTRRMVLWQRCRDYFDPETFVFYDAADDSPLWVAEQLSTCLCVSELWAWRVRMLVDDFPQVADELGLPWRIDAGALRPGLTVRLEAANGQWLWRLTGEPAACCGGYLARWPD